MRSDLGYQNLKIFLSHAKTIKIISNVLGAQVFQQLSNYSSSSDPENKHAVFRNIFFQKLTYFPSKRLGGTHNYNTKKAGKMQKFC